MCVQNNVQFARGLLTPAESTLATCPLMLGLSGGNAWPWPPDCAEDGIVPPGDASGSGGGDIGYICEARREAVVELWRDSEPDAVPDGLLVMFGRGDAGTELRSGAIVASSCSLRVELVLCSGLGELLPGPGRGYPAIEELISCSFDS